MKIAFKPLALIPPLVLATLVNPHVLAYRASTTSVSNNKTEVFNSPRVGGFSIVALPRAAPSSGAVSRGDNSNTSPVHLPDSSKVFVLQGEKETEVNFPNFPWVTPE